MNPADPLFLEWAKRFGYAPWRIDSAEKRNKLARYWVAWKCGLPPDCKKAFRMVQLSGLLT